jgi:hypothetical protein
MWKMEGGNSCSGIDKTSGNIIIRNLGIKQLPLESMETSVAQDSKSYPSRIDVCSVYVKPKNATAGLIKEPVSFDRQAVGYILIVLSNSIEQTKNAQRFYK